MLNKVFIIVLLVGVFFSCKDAGISTEIDSEKEISSIDTNIDWLVGSWIDSTSFKMINQDYVEEWQKIAEDKFEGIKYSISKGKNRDTTILKIDKSEGKYYFTIGKDKEKSVFIQTKYLDNEIEFANTKDEFPYNVNYMFAGERLIINASGNINGQQKSIQFITLKKV